MAREYPAFPIVAVGVVVKKDGEVLLVKRATHPAHGRWSLPGGVVEVGETVKETAAREIREECGIEIEVGCLLEVLDRIIPDKQRRIRYHYVILDFEAKYKSGKLCASSDISEAHWVPLNQIRQYNLTEAAVRVISKGMEYL
jgi:mutator protein MutT